MQHRHFLIIQNDRKTIPQSPLRGASPLCTRGPSLFHAPREHPRIRYAAPAQGSLFEFEVRRNFLCRGRLFKIGENPAVYSFLYWRILVALCCAKVFTYEILFEVHTPTHLNCHILSKSPPAKTHPLLDRVYSECYNDT